MDYELNTGLNGDATSLEMREQIKSTRSALTEKVESLKDRVSNQVETTRNSVDNTIHSIKRTFDLKHQVEQHPWPMIGGAVFAGVILGHLTLNRRWPASETPSLHLGHDRGEDLFRSARSNGFAAAHRAAPDHSNKSHWLQSRIHGELSHLQSTAIAAGMGVFRDWIERSMTNVEHWAGAEPRSQEVDMPTQTCGARRTDA